MSDQASPREAYSQDDHQAVRGRLCTALSRDLADSLVEDPDGVARLAEMLNAGFQGFAAMSDFDVIAAVFEAGLDDRNTADVEQLLAVINDAGSQAVE